MMKKIIPAVFVCLALMLFMSASEWEGSAAASTELNFPAAGAYAATNSYPRHTVIEIVNLENGRSVKAIVSQGLETPGLLAVLSPEAANAIGLNPNSIGRILMSASSDPVIAPNSGNVYASGDPDHDPAASVRINGGLDPALRAELDALLAAENASAVSEEPVPPADTLASAGILTDSSMISEPAASGSSPAHSSSHTPSASESEIQSILSAETPQSAAGTAVTTASEPDASAIAATPSSAAVPAQEPSDTPPATAAASPVTEAVPPTTVPSAGTSPSGSSSAYEEAPQTVAQVPYTPPNYDDYYFYVVPAEPRVPVEPDPVLNPEDFLIPLDQYPSDYYPSNLFPEISAIPPAVSVTPAPVQTAVPEITPAVTGTTAPAPVPVTSTPASGTPAFSAPVISSLENGKFYVQLIAGPEAAGIESEISKLGQSYSLAGYPIAIMPVAGSGRTMYRLLIGPVNLGESGALLERFKVNYGDAFIRQGN